MATAEQKKTITKKRLQELRNQCRDHYNVVADGVLPDGADVRVNHGQAAGANRTAGWQSQMG